MFIQYSQEFSEYFEKTKNNFLLKSSIKKDNYKESVNKFIYKNYFTAKKENPESNDDIDSRSNFKKMKKINNSQKYNVNKKEYNKAGKNEVFNLFKEKEIKINNYDNDIKILESEEDFDSDEDIISDGVRKSKIDLNEALILFKKNKFKDIINYNLYYKYK